MSDQYNEQSHDGQQFAEDFAADEHKTTPTTVPGDKLTPEKVGEIAIKYATETVYAAAGVANLVAEKAKVFFDQQRKQLAAKTPEGVDPNFKQFVDTMPDQFKTFLDEVTKQYHEMAERGRHAVADLQQQVNATRAEKPVPSEAFDLHEGADVEDAESVVAPDVDDQADAAPSAHADAPAEGDQNQSF